MQKKFIHELLRNPPGPIHDPQKMMWFMFRGHINAFEDIRANNKDMGVLQGLIPMDLFHGYVRAGFPINIALEISQSAKFIEDPCNALLAVLGHWAIHEHVTPYIFAKDFWKILMQTKINNLCWGQIPETFLGTFRFPDPIIDQDGDPISDVLIAIRPRAEVERMRGVPFDQERGAGSRALLAWWMTDNGMDSGMGYFSQVIPDGNDGIFPDTFNKSYVTRDSNSIYPGGLVEQRDDIADAANQVAVKILKALIYVCSGNPDLRDQRDKILYKPKSLEPLASYREYTPLPYKLVGFTWKKSAEYKAGSWGVQPFMRYQPSGPGRSQYKWVLVKEHERTRRAKTVYPLQDNHEMGATC